MSDGIGTTYGEKAYDQHGMLATWFPDRPLRVGDIVTRSVNTGVLTVETSAAELFGNRTVLPTITDTTGPQSLTFQHGATIDIHAAVGAAPGRADVRFSGSASFIFAATGGSSSGYERLQPIRVAMTERASKAAWQPEWQLVTAVRTFAQCVVLIARGSGAAASLSLSAPSPLTAAPVLDALDLTLGASITSGDAAKWELVGGTPLYEGLTLHNRTFGRDRVDDKYLSEPTDPSEVVRARPTPLSLG